MTLHFRDTLTAHAGEAAEAVQASPRIVSRLHRGRRGKQARKSAIGLSLSLPEAIQASDSESDLEEEEALRHGLFISQFYRMPSVSRRDGRRLFDDIHEMERELDRLVRLVRREVEGLAGSASGAASTFSVFAFALEDWSR
jgi:gamma-tubulin complex component 5